MENTRGTRARAPHNCANDVSGTICRPGSTIVDAVAPGSTPASIALTVPPSATMFASVVW